MYAPASLRRAGAALGGRWEGGLQRNPADMTPNPSKEKAAICVAAAAWDPARCGGIRHAARPVDLAPATTKPCAEAQHREADERQ